MKIVRFISDGKILIGQSVDDSRALRIEGDLLGQWRVTDESAPIDKLLSPLIPTDILCIGINYRKHATETGAALPKNPLLFIKAGNSLNHPLDPIPVPRLSAEVDFEGELAVVIGKSAKHVSRQNALQYVLGYTCANDVSARDWQFNKDLGGGQFARGKSFDGFCPLGPCLVTADEIPDPAVLQLRTILNGQVMQDTSVGDLIFDVPALIESLSSTMTLRAGAVILTGTPHGVGRARTPPVFMKPGDRVCVEIDQIGRLENPLDKEE